jgi:hypothetical protein
VRQASLTKRFQAHNLFKSTLECFTRAVTSSLVACSHVDPCEHATSEEVTALLRLSQTETAGTMVHLCGRWVVYSARGDWLCEHLRNRIGPFTHFYDRNRSRRWSVAIPPEGGSFHGYYCAYNRIQHAGAVQCFSAHDVDHRTFSTE